MLFRSANEKCRNVLLIDPFYECSDSKVNFPGETYAAARTRHQRQAFGRILKKLGAGRLMRAIDGAPRIGSWLGSILNGFSEEIHTRPFLPLKSVRIQQLADRGFNCVDFRSWLRGELNVSVLKEFFEKYGSISLRTFTEEHPDAQTPKLPVMYGMHDWDSILEFCARHNRQYHTLVNQSLPLEHSLMAGHIIIDGEWVTLAAFEGYGTPRDVDERVSRLKVHQGKFGDPVAGWVSEELANLAMRLRHFQPIRPVTFEFSLYSYPVGVLKTPVVLWEWRGGAAYDLRTVISRLLPNTRHELVIELPRSPIARS